MRPLRKILNRCFISLFLAMICGFFWLNPTWEGIEKHIESKYPGVKNLDTARLKTMLEQGEEVILIDVRKKDEFSVSHLPRSQHIESPQKVRFEKNKSIVVYCSVGIRSAKFAETLGELGYTRVQNLRGSIFEWGNKGYPLVSANGPTIKVHPYNSIWGRLLLPELHQYQ